MNLKAKIARAVLFVALCGLCAFGALWRFSAAQAQDYPPSQLELRSNSQMQVGQPFVVDVFANVAAPAYGFGLQVRYDPNVLQLQLQPDNDGTLVPLRVGGAFMSAQRIRNTDGQEEGASVIDVVYTLLPPAEATTGEGFIGRMTFIPMQEAATEVELLSPRLIALANGTAVDLPVNAASALAVMPSSVPAPIVEAAAPVADPALNTAPEAAPIVEAPAQTEQPVVVVQPQPEMQNLLSSLNTSSDILAQMNRTNALMNAVLVGLLTMITILLGVISISSVLDAFEAARAPRPVLAYASMSPRTVPVQRPQAVRRQAQTRQAEEARRRLVNRARATRIIDTRDL